MKLRAKTPHFIIFPFDNKDVITAIFIKYIKALVLTLLLVWKQSDQLPPLPAVIILNSLCTVLTSRFSLLRINQLTSICHVALASYLDR